jgi:hypothetical protein
MENSIIGLGFLMLFIAAIWIVLTLSTICKVLVAILDELRSMNRGSDPED